MEAILEWDDEERLSRDFDDIEAMEAAATTFTDVLSVRDGVPMKLNLHTQEIMEMNINTLKLKEVTNPSSFEGGSIPTVGGLFSEYIFGTTAEERRKTWGYIDLHTTVLHPYVYEVLMRLQPGSFDNICAGNDSWVIDDKAKGLWNVRKVDSKDPAYDPENTGIDWFMENYTKIKFRRNNSRQRNEKIDFLETFKPEEIFINKWMVMPPFLRDVEFRDGPPKVPPINNLYSNVIRYSRSLSTSSVGFMFNIAKYNIQKNLVAIRQSFQKLIAKTDGFFHQHVLGKNPDYGARSVISCAVLDQYDKPEDCPIDLNHTGVPLGFVCSMLFPFVRRWIYKYLENMFNTDPEFYGPADPKFHKSGDDETVVYKVDEPMSLYTQDYIKKCIDNWITTYEDRFEPIVIPAKYKDKDGLVRKFNATINFTGRPYSSDTSNINASTIGKRPLTWTDLIYMACVDVSENKAVWTTRYPIIGYMSSFPSMIHVLSTVNTVPMMVDNRIYPHYPVVDSNMPKNMIERSFVDTVTMANGYLAAINGDYDGDTVSMRIPFLEESNEESIDIIGSKKHYLNAQGKMVRMVKNESHLMVYNLTRVDPNAKWCDETTKGKFLALRSEDIGIKKLAELFGTNYNKNTKQITGPKYEVTTKLHLNAGEYINKEAVDTTLGQFVFNKILIEPYVSEIVPNGYIDYPLNKKGVSNLMEGTIGNALLYDRITTDKTWPFLKAWEFYTTKGVSIFAPSYTANMLVPKKEFLKERDDFFKNNPDASIDQIVKMEDSIVSKATKMLENDPCYPIFASDARGSVADNYRTMSIFAGPVKNMVTGEWDIVKSDFVTGFQKEELAAAGNMLVNGQYPKSVGTADSGYYTKQFNATYQSARVNPDENSDCGTKSYILITFSKDNWKQFEFQNVYDGDNLVPLDENNYTKFLDKPVKMRSPMCCKDDVYCAKCAGRRPYILGVTAIGLQMGDFPNQLLELSMKKFHVSEIKVNVIDPNSLLI